MGFRMALVASSEPPVRRVPRSLWVSSMLHQPWKLNPARRQARVWVDYKAGNGMRPSASFDRRADEAMLETVPNRLRAVPTSFLMIRETDCDWIETGGGPCKRRSCAVAVSHGVWLERAHVPAA